MTRVTSRLLQTLPEVAERLRSFDRASARQRRRQKAGRKGASTERGWTRESLNERGRAPTMSSSAP